MVGKGNAMKTRILPLNDVQLSALPQDIDRDARPFRVLCRGKAVNLCTGHLIGGNIVNQIVYWDRPQTFVDAALAGLRENNPGETFRVTRH
jgi:hypothetical protein